LRRRKRWLRRGGAALLILILGLLALAYAMPLPARLVASDSAICESQDQVIFHVFLSSDAKWRIPVTVGEVDPAYVRALLRLEDKRFRYHPGFDPLAVGRALVQNLWRRRVVSGASTLTMQLARILAPRPRSLRAKLLQTFVALQLELRLSKDQILAAYLRFLPFGQNIEGIEAASLTYFGHRSSALSAAEIATLLAVPQDPRRRFPGPAHAARLAAARDQIARRLLELGGLAAGNAPPAAVLTEVLATPVPPAMRPLPREALHLAQWLRAQSPGRLRLRTTLDRAVQRQCESLVHAAQPEAARRGIYNAAVVVVDNATASVRAAVGNFDFWDAAHNGQVVGFAAQRSPGSALKPLLYALSIDQGVALPDFLLPDVPLDYSGYAPRNFEKDYRGLVRLDEALWRSLNLPFVHLLARYGVDRFIGALSNLGVQNLSPKPGHYGLSAIIGGLELSPLELASVYVTLARDGRYQPLRFLHESKVAADLRIYGPGAAYLTRQALRHKDRPDCPSRQRLSGVTPAIAWKTGTSFGYRDAWAAGFGARYTAVIWVGNFDGTASAALVGSEAAGPLLFDILDALGDAKQSGAEPVPQELQPVEVCAYSGHPPGPACPQRRTTLAAVRSVPTTVCPYHVQAEVDVRSGLRVAMECRSRYQTEPRSFLVWPSSVRRYLGQQTAPPPALPTYAPGCLQSGRTPAPVITSPASGQTLLLIPGLPRSAQRVPLYADSTAGGPLSWFVDGELLGSCGVDERLYWTPEVGTHELAVTDASGRAAQRSLKVLAAAPN
jgi:penicillin-binding protein 1C